MDKFNPPNPLTFDGNLRRHWKRLKQELELYLVAESDREENKIRSSILLSCIGPQGKEIWKQKPLTTKL